MTALSCVRRAFGALAILTAGARGADAQTCTASSTTNTCSVSSGVTMSVLPTERLDIAAQTGLSASTFTLFTNAVSVTDYTAGFKQAGVLAMTAKSNSAATLTINGSSAKYTTPSTKNASDLLWSVAGTGCPSSAYTPLGTTVTTLCTLPSTGSAGTDITLSFRTNLALTADAPGAYTLPFTLTIKSP